MVANDGPVLALEELIDSVCRYVSFLRSNELLARLEIGARDLLETFVIILGDLGSSDDRLRVLIPSNNHVSFWQFLLRRYLALDLDRLCWLMAPPVIQLLSLVGIVSLVLHDDLLYAPRSVAVHVDAFARPAHLKDLVYVHGPQHEVVAGHVLDEFLCFDTVEHLA